MMHLWRMHKKHDHEYVKYIHNRYDTKYVSCSPGVVQAVAEDDVGGGLDAPAAPLDGRPHWAGGDPPLLLAPLDRVLHAEGLQHMREALERVD